MAWVPHRVSYNEEQDIHAKPGYYLIVTTSLEIKLVLSIVWGVALT
jgi:hypothetical protein